MNYHEKTNLLLSTFGIAPKKTAEILGRSASLVYQKRDSLQGNKFNIKDFIKITNFIKSNLHLLD